MPGLAAQAGQPQEGDSLAVPVGDRAAWPERRSASAASAPADSSANLNQSRSAAPDRKFLSACVAARRT